MYSSIIDNIITAGACQYDGSNRSIDSYYDSSNDINYILIPLREENYWISTITNIQFSSDFESTELCFIVQEPWSGVPTSIDDYPIGLGDARDPIYLELANAELFRFDERCPRKVTFIYIRDHYPPDCSELKNLPGIRIRRNAFTIPTDRLEDFIITIGCSIQWEPYAFGDQFIKSPIFFWGSLSDWCGGSQNFELCEDYYDLEHQDHLDTIASNTGLCLSEAWDGLIYVRDSLVQNQDPLFKELLLTEIFLTQDLIENIQKNDEKKRNGSLAFYLKREYILPEPDSEPDEIKLKIIFTEESIKNETNLKEIRRLFLVDSDNKYDYFSDLYGCPLYLESDSTLVVWTQHDHNLMDLWWGLGIALPEKAPFYIYDTESQITLTDILQNSSIIKIGDYAFAGMRFERDTQLDFSQTGILSIGKSAFDYCTNYMYKWYITLPKQIILKENSLSVSGSIVIVYFEGEAKEWPEFYAQQMRQALNGSSLTYWRSYRFDLYCNGSLLDIFGEQEFYQNEKINLTEGAFYNVTSLKTIYLAASTPIYEHTFNLDSNGIKTIYSRLTLSQWKNLPYYIQPSNNIDIYLYSKQAPSEEDLQSGYCFWYPLVDNMVIEGFSLSSDKNKNMIDSKYFQVSHDGKIHAENAEIAGHIHANSLTLDKSIVISKDNISPSEVETSFVVDTNAGIISMNSRSLFMEGQDLMINSPHLQLNWNPQTKGDGWTSGTGHLEDGYFAIDTTNFKVNSEGKITATKGEIAGWEVGDIYNSDDTLMGSGIYNWQENQNLSTGMAAMSEADNTAFWAGCNKEHPWKEGANCNFLVNNEGRLIAKDCYLSGKINSPEAVIGFLTIDEDSARSPNNALRIGYGVIYSETVSADNLITQYITYPSSKVFGSGVKPAIWLQMTGETNTYSLAIDADQSSYQDGYNNFWETQIEYAGFKKVCVTISQAVSDSSVPVEVTLQYSSFFNGQWNYIKRTYSGQIEQNQTQCFVTAPYRIQVGAYIYKTNPYFVGTNSCTLSPTTVEIPKDGGELIPQLRVIGNTIPNVDDYSLGSSGNRWNYVYAANGDFTLLYSQSGKVDGSDRNKKNTIDALSSNYTLLFDQLRPVTFKYNEGTSDRLHTGFIAQEVRDAAIDAGLTTKDFAAYCEWEDDNGEVTCGLRYSEFIALCVDQIQKLKKRVIELENNNKES